MKPSEIGRAATQGVGREAMMHEINQQILAKDKVYQLEDFGLEIAERVPIQMEATRYDRKYLRTKQEKMGHLLNYS